MTKFYDSRVPATELVTALTVVNHPAVGCEGSASLGQARSRFRMVCSSGGCRYRAGKSKQEFNDLQAWFKKKPGGFPTTALIAAVIGGGQNIVATALT